MYIKPISDRPVKYTQAYEASELAAVALPKLKSFRENSKSGQRESRPIEKSCFVLMHFSFTVMKYNIISHLTSFTGRQTAVV